MGEDNVTMVAVDGSDALAVVIIKPGESNPEDTVTIEAGLNGISKEDAALILRRIADEWDPS